MNDVRLQRAAVLVVAALAVVWLAISYRDADRLEQAQFVAAGKSSSPARLEAAVRDLRSTRTLNPSRTDELAVEALLELRLSRPLAAAKVLEDMVRREPDAVEAWFLLEQIYRGRDAAGAAKAHAELMRLDPLTARRLHL